MASQGIGDYETELEQTTFGEVLRFYMESPPRQHSVEASKTGEGRSKHLRAYILQEQLKPTADRPWPKAFYLFKKRSTNDQESDADQIKRIQAFFTGLRPGPSLFGYGIVYRDLIDWWGVEIQWDSEPDVTPLDMIKEIKEMFKENLSDEVCQVDFKFPYPELLPPPRRPQEQ